MYPLTKKQIDDLMAEGKAGFKAKDICPYSKFSESGRLWLRGYANEEWASTNMKTSLDSKNGTA